VENVPVVRAVLDKGHQRKLPPSLPPNQSLIGGSVKPR
jgi:hypothetical protein